MANKNIKNEGVKFGQGQDPTKGGHPKGKRISTIIKELLEKSITTYKPDAEDKKLSANEGLAVELITMAFGKDKDKLNAIKEILDRIEGKAIQTNVIESKEQIKGITFDKE